MRVLLTRASEDAGRTRDKLEAAGHSVVLSPVIEIVASPVHWPPHVVDGLVVTSAHAFAAPIDGLSGEVRRLLPLLLVGARTEDGARAAGFSGAIRVAKTAAELIADLDAHAAWPKRAVYLAAEDRKPDIEAAFAERGAELDVLVGYRAQPTDGLSDEARKAIANGTVDAVLHFSRRSADLLLDACEKTGVGVSRPAHFCLSQDVAAGLQARGDFVTKVAASPTEAELLALLD